MIDLNCYIYADESLQIFCVECHDKMKEKIGSFYEGSRDGYSNYLWECSICKKIIHQPENLEEIE